VDVLHHICHLNDAAVGLAEIQETHAIVL
jgi:hypothetical protein